MLIRRDCAGIGRGVGVGISATQWEQLAHVEEEPGLYPDVKELLIYGGGARSGVELSLLTGPNMCLYSAAEFLCMTELYSSDVGDGPPIVSRCNKNVRSSSRGSAGGAYLGFRIAFSSGEMDIEKPPKFARYAPPASLSDAVGHLSRLNSTCLQKGFKFPTTRKLRISQRTALHSIR